MDEKLVMRVLQEYKVHNADILFREDATVDDFIDVMEVLPGHTQSCIRPDNYFACMGGRRLSTKAFLFCLVALFCCLN